MRYAETVNVAVGRYGVAYSYDIDIADASGITDRGSMDSGYTKV